MLRSAAQAELKLQRAEVALQFIRNLAVEEYPNTRCGTGSEIALRHIIRKCMEVRYCEGEDEN